MNRVEVHSMTTLALADAALADAAAAPVEGWGRRLARSLFRRIGRAGDRATTERGSAVPGVLGPWGFAASLDRTLGLLGGVHAGITLFAVSLRAAEPAAEAVMAAALSPLGAVGRLPDGRIGLGYLGPGGGAGGDGPATERLIASVRARVATRLIEEGRHGDAERLEVSATHAWTDRVKSAAALIRRLPRAS